MEEILEFSTINRSNEQYMQYKYCFEVLAVFLVPHRPFGPQSDL